MNVLMWIVSLTGVAGAGTMLVVGIVQDVTYGNPLRDAAKAVLESGKESVQANIKLIENSQKDDAKTQTLEAHANALDTLGSTFEGLAKLATALKDLDAATRAYLLAVVFLVVATVSTSIGIIAT